LTPDRQLDLGDRAESAPDPGNLGSQDGVEFPFPTVPDCQRHDHREADRDVGKEVEEQRSFAAPAAVEGEDFPDRRDLPAQFDVGLETAAADESRPAAGKRGRGAGRLQHRRQAYRQALAVELAAAMQ
jgi:hypothetical protein